SGPPRPSSPAPPATNFSSCHCGTRRRWTAPSSTCAPCWRPWASGRAWASSSSLPIRTPRPAACTRACSARTARAFRMARHRARAQSDLAAVPQLKRDARPHVALELAGDLRIDHHARALHQLPDGGILRLVVLEGLHADLALAEGRRGGELARELCLQP